MGGVTRHDNLDVKKAYPLKMYTREYIVYKCKKNSSGIQFKGYIAVKVKIRLIIGI